MKGISDETYNRFLDLCDVLHVSPMAVDALELFLHEIYYEGYDLATKEVTSKNDLKRGISRWANKIGKSTETPLEKLAQEDP